MVRSSRFGLLEPSRLACDKKKHRLQRFIIFRSRDWHNRAVLGMFGIAESQMGDLDAKLERGLLDMWCLSKVHELGEDG
jgi:hypothetical protein